MGRLFTPFQQFFDKNGNPLSSGKLEFFVNEDLSNQQVTYSDPNLNNQNQNPVILDGEGRVLDVFGDGVYTVTLRDKYNVLIDTLDTVGGDIGSRTAFSDWTSTIIYNIPAIVVGSDGKYYENQSTNNLNNNPVSSPTFWEEIRFLGVYNQFISYSTGDVTQTNNGELWKSNADDNLNNNPLTDDGTNWSPAVSIERTLETISTVIAQSGGGDLTALRINEIRDGSTYNIPLANTVNEDQTIIISQPDRYVLNEPTISASGSDTITDSEGADADGNILFNQQESVSITLTSDGVSNWSL